MAAASSQQHDDDDDDGGADGFRMPTMDQEAWTLDGWGDAPSVVRLGPSLRSPVLACLTRSSIEGAVATPYAALIDGAS